MSQNPIEELKELRLRKGISQGKLGKMLGKSRSYIGNMEIGRFALKDPGPLLEEVHRLLDGLPDAEIPEEKPEERQETAEDILADTSGETELAQRFGADPENVREVLENNKLPHFNVFGRRFVREKDLTAYVRGSYTGDENLAVLYEAEIEDLQKKLNEARKAYEDETGKLRTTVDELTHQVGSLESENTGLKTDIVNLKSSKLNLEKMVCSNSVKTDLLKRTLVENCPGEYAALLLFLVKEKYESMDGKARKINKRQAQLLRDIIDHNDIDPEYVKFRDSLDNMQPFEEPEKFIAELQKVGFGKVYQNGHRRLLFRDNPDYAVTIATTPSDRNWSKTEKREVRHMLLVDLK